MGREPGKYYGPLSEEEHKRWLLHVRDGFKSVGERSNLSHLMGEKKLNLGSGMSYEPSWNGWDNADINPRTGVDLIFDARKPWPIESDTYDTILAHLFLQMLFPGEELFYVLSEAYRVLKPLGFLVAAVPDGFRGDPMQKSFWSERTPHMLVKSVYFDPCWSTTGWDQGLPIRDWILVGVEKPDLIWFVLQKPSVK